ncbi:MAG: hypothetical protein NZ839_04465, partial [Endomicrobia bacterium]|nr:hypothetical protein [Endomicrobiia bacterium]
KLKKITSKNITNEMEEKIKLAWELIYINEGSDWYWWFGEEHYTAQGDIFDFLFRKHLKNVYFLLNQAPPDYLEIPIKTKFKKIDFQLPSDFISPVVDGKISSYFEWSSAGRCSQMFSSMHQAKTIITSIYFGFDLENLYIRIDYDENIIYANMFQICIYIKSSDITKEDTCCIKFDLHPENDWYLFISADGSQQKMRTIKIDKIVELQIPFGLLSTSPGQLFKFFITLIKKVEEKNYEVERIPHQGFIEVVHPDKSYLKHYWTV